MGSKFLQAFLLGLVLIASATHGDAQFIGEYDNNYRRALKGHSPDFSRGGVILSELTASGMPGPAIGPIRGSEDHDLLDKLWAAAQALPAKERAMALQSLIHHVRGFWFKVSLDIDGKGKRPILVEYIPPIDKEIISPKLEYPNYGGSHHTVRLLIMNNSVKYFVTFATITVPNYDDKLGSEDSFSTYINSQASIDGFFYVAPIGARTNV
jgi:hypothetical protein